MISLIMDTSNQYLVVSLYEDGKCLDTIQELGSKKQSENAILYLSSLLEKHHKELLDIDEMIITRGPGSYTGVRVAMTIAKTLSVVSNIKIKAISSLQAYVGFQDAISVIDARSKKVFLCVYKQGKALMEEKMIEASEFKEFSEQYPGYQVLGECHAVDCPHVEVDIAKNMYELSRNIDPIDNVDCLVPTYLKDVEAKKLCI